MTTIKEMAEEYAKANTSGLHVPYFRDAYLAGARATLEMAAHKAAQKTAMLPSDSDYTRGYAIARSDMCDEIRNLIPKE